MQPNMVSAWFHMILGEETQAQSNSLAPNPLFTMTAQIPTKTPWADELTRWVVKAFI